MKKKPSSFIWLFLPALCWIVATLIQLHIRGPAEKRPLPRNRISYSDTVTVDELENALSKFDARLAEDRPYVLPADALAVSLSTKTRIRERDIKNRPADSEEIKNDKGYYFVDSNK